MSIENLVKTHVHKDENVILKNIQSHCKLPRENTSNIPQTAIQQGNNHWLDPVPLMYSVPSI